MEHQPVRIPDLEFRKPGGRAADDGWSVAGGTAPHWNLVPYDGRLPKQPHYTHDGKHSHRRRQNPPGTQAHQTRC